jgi:hypothetical protein
VPSTWTIQKSLLVAELDAGIARTQPRNHGSYESKRHQACFRNAENESAGWKMSV